MENASENRRHLYGVATVLLSAFLFYFSTVFVKLPQAAGHISSGFFMLARFTVGLVMISGFLIIRNKKPSPKNWPVLAGRGLCNFIALYLFFMAVQETTVAHANILNMTYPVFMPFLSFFFLPKQRDFYSYILSFVAFAGIVLVLDPSVGGISADHLWGLGSGMMASFAMLFLTIARHENDTETVLFFMFLIGTICSAVCFHQEVFLPDFEQSWMIFLAALTGVLGQFAVTWGYRYVTAVEGGVLGSSRILIAALCGPFITGEASLSIVGWCGAIIVFTVNVLIASKKEVE